MNKVPLEAPSLCEIRAAALVLKKLINMKFFEGTEYERPAEKVYEILKITA